MSTVNKYRRVAIMDTAQDIIASLVEKIAEEQKYDNHDAKIKSVNSNGANITSELFLVTISAKDKEDLELFAKAAVLSENVRKTLPMTCPFTTELYFYSNILQRYENLQEKHDVPKEDRLLFPKIYATYDEFPHETLVLENIVARGFEIHDRMKPIDFEYASTAIENMAKFHALSLACHKEDPKDFEKVLRKLTVSTSKMLGMIDVIKPKMLSTAYSAVTEENREKLENFFDEGSGRDRFFEYLSNYRCTEPRVLTHGDFKPSNLMHKRQNGKLQMIPVDFQMVRNASPVTDLMYFLFTATDEELRRQHYHRLLDHYYEQLQLALKRLHVDAEEVYSEKMYREELEEHAMDGVMIGVVLLPMITVAEENVPVFGDDADVTDFVVPASEVYRERFNGLVNNYKEWGLL